MYSHYFVLIIRVFFDNSQKFFYIQIFESCDVVGIILLLFLLFKYDLSVIFTIIFITKIFEIVYHYRIPPRIRDSGLESESLGIWIPGDNSKMFAKIRYSGCVIKTGATFCFNLTFEMYTAKKYVKQKCVMLLTNTPPNKISAVPN